MWRRTERSAVQASAKRGKGARQIAAELGRSPTTINRFPREPVDRPPALRRRRSRVIPHRDDIARWLAARLTETRMLESARADAAHPHMGSRGVFEEAVRRVRQERERERERAAVGAEEFEPEARDVG